MHEAGRAHRCVLASRFPGWRQSGHAIDRIRRKARFFLAFLPVREPVEAASHHLAEETLSHLRAPARAPMSLPTPDHR
jgi:hypothetical protein